MIFIKALYCNWNLSIITPITDLTNPNATYIAIVIISKKRPLLILSISELIPL